MIQHGFPIQITRCAFKEAGLDYGFSPHTHADYQWYAVLSGQVLMEYDGECHAIDPDQSILFPPGMYRAPRAGKTAPCYFYVNFRNPGLELKAFQGRIMSATPDLRSDLQAVAMELRQAPESNTNVLIYALAVRLLVGLNRLASQGHDGTRDILSPRNVTYHEQQVQQVETFMNRNLHRCLSRRELARAANVSPAHLGRIFLATLGKTPGRRLSELRMAYAKEMLLNSTLSISQVAMAAGYQSFSHFSKIFKQTSGIPPSEYRRSDGHIWVK